MENALRKPSRVANTTPKLQFDSPASLEVRHNSSLLSHSATMPIQSSRYTKEPQATNTSQAAKCPPTQEANTVRLFYPGLTSWQLPHITQPLFPSPVNVMLFAHPHHTIQLCYTRTFSRMRLIPYHLRS